MHARRTEGAETWHRLREWDRGQAAAERLAAQILQVSEYQSVDPAHPLGGPDGLRDAICKKNDDLWIAAVYFPRGQQSFSEIRAKFAADLRGADLHKADGVAFTTNQEIRLSERDELVNVASVDVDILHLERVASILNSPPCYGLRLEFLDIEMTKEEQLAFLAARDVTLQRMEATQLDIVRRLEDFHERETSLVPAEPFIVTVGMSYTISLFEDTVHKCTNCRFGYYVRRFRGLPAFRTTGAACPKCGNVDALC